MFSLVEDKSHVVATRRPHYFRKKKVWINTTAHTRYHQASAYVLKLDMYTEADSLSNSLSPMARMKLHIPLLSALLRLSR